MLAFIDECLSEGKIVCSNNSVVIPKTRLEFTGLPVWCCPICGDSLSKDGCFYKGELILDGLDRDTAILVNCVNIVFYVEAGIILDLDRYETA